MDTWIANAALHLATEWTPDWGRPTQERLHSRYPHLSEADLDFYDALARSTMKMGYGYVDDNRDCELSDMAKHLKTCFPWASEENLSRLYGQGRYYAFMH
jgi:hypothetical protein